MRAAVSFIAIIITLLVWIQCNDDLSKQSEDSCEFKSEANISIPSNTSITYKIHQYLDEAQTFVAYHYRTHSLDFIDISNNTFLKKLYLDKEGPARVSQVISLYVHSLDSIFLLTVNQLIGTDQDGNEFFNIKINQRNSDIHGFDLKKFRIWCNPEHNQPIYYSKEYNSIYVGIKPYDTKVSLENYKLSIAGKIEIESLEFSLLPIYYPQDFQTDYYGILDNPHLIFFDDFTIVGFGALYNLFRFDHSTGDMIQYNLSSNYIKGRADKLGVENPEKAFSDFEVIKKHFDDNPRTAKLRIYRGSNVLYNLYYASKDPENPHYRTISIFHIDNDGTHCEKVFEWVVDHDRYMTKMFFPTEKGLGLIDKSSTDDILNLLFMECLNL